MSFGVWIALAGGLLMIMALSAAYLRSRPVTSSGIYLVLGLAVSPVWLGLIEIDFILRKSVFEHLTEVAVIVSLIAMQIFCSQFPAPATRNANDPAMDCGGTGDGDIERSVLPTVSGKKIFPSIRAAPFAAF